MIDLFSIKINGQFDDIGATPTIDSGVFLCDTTGDDYTKGYTYQITKHGNETEAVRIDAVTDYKIKKAIYPTIHNTCEWLNNWFTVRRNYSNFWSGSYNYGSSGQWHDVPQQPSTGDLCKVRSTMYWEYAYLYNFFFVSYVTVDGSGHVTCDNPEFKPDENYFYYVMHLPQDVENVISQMIYYDIFTRGAVDGLKSENIGNYSYSKEDVAVGSLSYPSEIMAGLETTYKKVRFVS